MVQKRKTSAVPNCFPRLLHLLNITALRVKRATLQPGPPRTANDLTYTAARTLWKVDVTDSNV